jgi:DNA-binding XRE family transcriptional regulator
MRREIVMNDATQARGTESREEVLEIVSINLRRLAAMHGIRQDGLARQVDLSRQAVHNLFVGRSLPGPLNARRIADAFGLPSSDLLFGDAGTLLRAAAEVYESSRIQRHMPAVLERRREEEERRQGTPEGASWASS